MTSLGLRVLNNSMTSRPSSTISVQVSNDGEDRNITAVRLEDKSLTDDVTNQLIDHHDDGMIDNPDVSMSEETRTDSDIGEKIKVTK